MKLAGPQGDINLGLPPLEGERYPGRIRALGEFGAAPVCPICLTADPTAREHVPQGALGGKVMTRTCSRCNNELGSRVETELQHFYDRALPAARITVAGLEGSRRVPRILVRTTDDGKPVIMLDVGNMDAELDRQWSSVLAGGGSFEVEYRNPDPSCVQIAALKHAYLASCVLLQAIPDTPRAASIRAELMAARDLPRGENLLAGEIAKSLTVRITGMDPIDYSILLVDWLGPNDQMLTEILLAGTLSVSWPLEHELLERVDRIAGLRDQAIEAARTKDQPGVHSGSDDDPA